MAEVEGRKIDEVDDEDDLSPCEVGSNEKHYECKV